MASTPMGDGWASQAMRWVPWGMWPGRRRARRRRLRPPPGDRRDELRRRRRPRRQRRHLRHAKSPEDAAQMMIDGERFMVSGDTAKAAHTTAFRGVGTDSAHGVVFHCTAGRDRTGWSEAALLTALGVPQDTIMADYLAGSDYRAAANKAALDRMPPAQAAVCKPMLDVRPEYLNAGLDEVREQYGSFNSYLDRALDLDARDVCELRDDLLVG
ncbi:tyrosine-protein phosphatase [Embleya scabrispora]|uniref:tyrosine-protein phosphatase n=1 Tax=Embleya scabrispora TaxID=159449 RepID=UPI002AA55EEF